MLPSVIAFYAIAATAVFSGAALLTTWVTDYFDPASQIEKAPQRIIDTGERLAGSVAHGVENAVGSGVQVANKSVERISDTVKNVTGGIPAGIPNVSQMTGKLIGNGGKSENNNTGSSILDSIKKVGEPIANVVGKIPALAPTLPALPTVPSVKNIFGLG